MSLLLPLLTAALGSVAHGQPADPADAAAPAPPSSPDCASDMLYVTVDTIDPTVPWRLDRLLCEGARLKIEVPGDRALLRSLADQPAHGVLGRPDEPTLPGSPCMDCRAGMLVVAFEPADGPAVAVPYDTGDLLAMAYRAVEGRSFRRDFVAPVEGRLVLRFNDPDTSGYVLEQGEGVAVRILPGDWSYD